MKCPLFGLGYIASRKVNGSISIDCIKEECAVFDEDNEQCSLLTLARGIFIFNKQMIDLLNKMPPHVPKH